MGIVEKIKDIEAEMARTQKNKATEYHLGSPHFDPLFPYLDFSAFAKSLSYIHYISFFVLAF